ncbi:small capsid protein [Macropodid alphaherpesvirus 2]|uniref:Small capsomere-interacting protein n=1 Tax=Macropodid alphaherpesvirus 2 TaxID=83440 RepID=A0AAE7SXX2_9ALPH|nr:small capsid protein [Macropodid alphaherpesvirus 2]QOD40255.1 small capsid protein [Macropodid alphaherpesvirus 2]WGO49729.1 small capsid protein [Macropodid alphaherpesvirus 2]
MNPLHVSAPLRPVRMASSLQFHLPATIKTCEIKKLPIDELITRVNAAPPIDPDNTPPDVTRTAAHEFLLGQTSAFRHLCRSHSKNTIERQPMFFGESNNTWLRPTFGLRRTFSPFMVKRRDAS